MIMVSPQWQEKVLFSTFFLARSTETVSENFMEICKAHNEDITTAMWNV